MIDIKELLEECEDIIEDFLIEGEISSCEYRGYIVDTLEKIREVLGDTN